MSRPITVSITTRNRPAALGRCLQSLRLARDLIQAVIVVDDASEPAVDSGRLREQGTDGGLPIELVRLDKHTGTAAAKNIVARRATTPYLLSLDDDAFLVSEEAVASALAVLARDPDIAAVAFAQSDEHASRRPAGQQAAAAERPCLVPAFIGFGCLIRREYLLAVGGYRDEFVIHGEEREVCLRWLERGWRVVYLPDAPVAHVADHANRDARSYVRHVIRNDCLNALYNEPSPRALLSIPVRLWNFRRMAARIPGGDPGGVRWIVGELWSRWPAIRRERRPVRWRTLREWRRLRDSTPHYSGPGAPAAR